MCSMVNIDPLNLACCRPPLDSSKSRLVWWNEFFHDGLLQMLRVHSAVPLQHALVVQSSGRDLTEKSMANFTATCYITNKKS